MSNQIERFIQRFQMQLPPLVSKAQQQRQAAVLVPIIRSEDPVLLLTQRSSLLRHHPGQISFPGGAVDKTDCSIDATALREAHEEIGLNPKSVKIVGRLSALDSVSGFQVTPVVGILPEGLRFKENKSEVDRMFEVPLRIVLNKNNFQSIDIMRQGKLIRIYFIHYNDNFIWGLTASILHRLSRQVDGLYNHLINKDY